MKISILIGYFPKKTSRLPELLEALNVEEVCSVSNCISEGPVNWIDAWKHNSHWVYDTPELAASVIGENEGVFEMYAFKQYPIRVDSGEIQDEPVSEPNVNPLMQDYEFLGYDAVSRSNGNAFECSPLSCNYGAKKMAVNSHCLFDSLDEAIKGAKTFSRGSWEPGPYYVIEVFRKKDK
jgi:hypothetical protein